MAISFISCSVVEPSGSLAQITGVTVNGTNVVHFSGSNFPINNNQSGVFSTPNSTNATLCATVKNALNDVLTITTFGAFHQDGIHTSGSVTTCYTGSLPTGNTSYVTITGSL